jgi:dienelactone hydrolase
MCPIMRLVNIYVTKIILIYSKSFKDFVKATSWNESVRADLALVLKEYKAQNVSEFGIFGFCFGGKISAHAAGEYYEDIKVAAQFHPAGADVADAVLIKSPTILLPGANDPNMVRFYLNLC